MSELFKDHRDTRLASVRSLYLPRTHKDIVCHECGETHVNKEFSVNKRLIDLINAEIGTIDFGSLHKEVINLRDQIDDARRKAGGTIDESENFINRKISELKQKS